MLLTERDAYIGDIARWCQAFRPILGPLLTSLDPKTAVSASQLMIEALHAEISLAGAFFTEECSYDTYLPHYKEINFLSRVVSQRGDKIFPKDVPTFSLSAGTAWCLYDAASNCRDPVLRQEALSMLRCQAGQDQTKYKARLVIDASHMIALEEQGRREDGFLPESARYRRLWVLNNFEDEFGALTFICARKLGYPIGKAYPAKREWRSRTFSAAEVADMTVGETLDSPWPLGVAKPNFMKWQEVHKELLEATAGMCLALDQYKDRLATAEWPYGIKNHQGSLGWDSFLPELQVYQNLHTRTSKNGDLIPNRTYGPARMFSRSPTEFEAASNPRSLLVSLANAESGEAKVAQPSANHQLRPYLRRTIFKSFLFNPRWSDG